MRPVIGLAARSAVYRGAREVPRLATCGDAGRRGIWRRVLFTEDELGAMMRFPRWHPPAARGQPQLRPPATLPARADRATRPRPSGKNAMR